MEGEDVDLESKISLIIFQGKDGEKRYAGTAVLHIEKEKDNIRYSTKKEGYYIIGHKSWLENPGSRSVKTFAANILSSMLYEMLSSSYSLKIDYWESFNIDEKISMLLCHYSGQFS